MSEDINKSFPEGMTEGRIAWGRIVAGRNSRHLVSRDWEDTEEGRKTGMREGRKERSTRQSRFVKDRLKEERIISRGRKQTRKGMKK